MLSLHFHFINTYIDIHINIHNTIITWPHETSNPNMHITTMKYLIAERKTGKATKYGYYIKNTGP